MSYLFRGNKKYFEFIEALEQEEQAFRQMGMEYAAKSDMNNKEYKKRAATATLSLRRVGEREIRKVDPRDITKSRGATATSQKTRKNEASKTSFLDSSPAHVLSTDWPVRPNSAQRILAPAKLKKYLDLGEDVYKRKKDLPLIHNTGIRPVPNDRQGPLFLSPPSTPLSGK